MTIDNDHVVRILEAVVLAKDDAMTKGFKKGHPGQSFIQCPVCQTKLHYSVASNGHMMARCETKDCVAWLE